MVVGHLPIAVTVFPVPTTGFLTPIVQSYVVHSVDPFTRKEWYDIKAPSNFSVRACGKTPVTRTTGTKIASEMLKGRVFEICLADLNKDEDQAYRKIKLQCEEVQGKYCLTQFYGLDFTTDKIRSMVRKWQSLITVRGSGYGPGQRPPGCTVASAP